MSDGWFDAEDSKIRNAEGNPVGIPNVSGRFEDFKIVDGPASKAARKNVYRIGVVLYSRIHVSSNGSVSNEKTGYILDFRPYPDGLAEEAAARIQRFPDAWRAYQRYRKAPLQDGESEVLLDLGLSDTVKKRGHRPKAAAAGGKVVPLKPDAA